MKTFIMTLALTMATILSTGNGSPAPPHISEIVFDSAGNWTVEIIWTQQWYRARDTLWIESSNGESMVISGTYYYTGHTLMVITDTNLASPLHIDPEGDYVKIRNIFNWPGFNYYFTDSVAFGNYPGSFVDQLRPGQSYAILHNPDHGWQNYGFAIDNSPTLGMLNDTTGAMFTLTGKIYSPDGQPFTLGEFELIPHMSIPIGPDGIFSERVPSRRYILDEIILSLPPDLSMKYAISNWNVSAYPDSVCHQDIYTIGVVGVVEKEKPHTELANGVTVSPNPFARSITFFIKPLILESAGQAQLLIIDPQGIILKEIALQKDQYRYDWMPASGLAAGMYIYRLVRNGTPVLSGKIIKL